MRTTLSTPSMHAAETQGETSYNVFRGVMKWLTGGHFCGA